MWISPEAIVPHRTTHSERLALAPREHTPVDTAKVDRRTVELSLPKSAYYACPQAYQRLRRISSTAIAEAALVKFMKEDQVGGRAKSLVPFRISGETIARTR